MCCPGAVHAAALALFAAPWHVASFDALSYVHFSADAVVPPDGVPLALGSGDAKAFLDDLRDDPNRRDDVAAAHRACWIKDLKELGFNWEEVATKKKRPPGVTKMDVLFLLAETVGIRCDYAFKHAILAPRTCCCHLATHQEYDVDRKLVKKVYDFGVFSSGPTIDGAAIWRNKVPSYLHWYQGL